MDSLAVWLGVAAAVFSVGALVLQTCGLRQYLRERHKQKVFKKAWNSYWDWFEKNRGLFIRL